MNERERILSLVKQGVISSEEALVLLENLAKQETTEKAVPSEDEPTPQAEPSAHESELARLNAEIAAQTGRLDALVAQQQQLTNQIEANREQIIVLDTMEDLDTLTEEQRQKRGALKQENLALSGKLSEFSNQADQVKATLADLNAQKRKLSRQAHLDRAADWQAQAKDVLTDLGQTVSDATGQIGRIVKSTAKTVLDNVDWKDVTVKMPGVATERFSHTFSFDAADLAVIDVRLASGTVTVVATQNAQVSVDANVKLYGKMKEPTALAAFLARSQVALIDNQLTLHSLSQRVAADLTIHLPKAQYAQLQVKVLNGDIEVSDLNAAVVNLKSTNGNLSVTQVQATSLSLEGVNSDIRVAQGAVSHLVATTVHGDIRLTTTPSTSQLSTVDGTIRATVSHDFERLEASTVNGDVKLAVPTGVALRGEAKARFGTVKSRMSGVAEDKTSHLNLDRDGSGVGALQLTTTSGEIKLKDADSDQTVKEKD